ncbi:tRNA-uridine aminocarboxypropyltransferase [Marinobacter nanhaiticus D15-8W]|uniref:tRNA-uridine aminocarboxypropyltransferase n=1 Tax=Marinobacter nanhaiticus D15-8W TaxID=626887 RepID=N6W402_9GAMM|nr:tRNA-uridine aminocarboxypropyltransferase [Marinobacter nanhaiticus]ENO14879.1 DTW domain-containing protein [Marinobacter nanhaiticus D15-8W]BES69425.1 tRNA-uridine aminocarboxypropyltransferase [Marinobacter nanhaiticus D15-8W]
MREGLCPDCGVHINICVCDVCETVADAPPLWVLQHPTEVAHSKGTLRVADACLPGLQTLIGEQPDAFSTLSARSARVPMGVLFPTLSSQPMETSDTSGISEWIVIDGTWRKARKIFLSNPWLNDLPQFHFDTPPASTYRIRKAPRGDSLSTAEAIAYLLEQVCPKVDTGPLKRSMNILVRRQLAQMPEDVQRRYDGQNRDQ